MRIGRKIVVFATIAGVAGVAAGCGGSGKKAESKPSDGVSTALPMDLGGRVFDRFYVLQGHKTFIPDKKSTPGDADGMGGPSNDGTANDKSGKKILNDAGHSYRLKSFWGWDLKGTAGIYGPSYKNKKYARKENLMADARSEAELLTWLQNGTDDGLPAYKDIVHPPHLQATARFIAAMRDGKLPRADDIWSLAASKGNYVLNPGADTAAGAQSFAATCKGCHGGDGTRIPLEGDELSLGAFVRAKGYEAWFKVLAGHPGTQMKGQVPAGLARKEAAAFILNTLAALCDRQAFPALKGGDDVPDGDPRCGAYLK